MAHMIHDFSVILFAANSAINAQSGYAKLGLDGIEMPQRTY